MSSPLTNPHGMNPDKPPALRVHRAKQVSWHFLVRRGRHRSDNRRNQGENPSNPNPDLRDSSFYVRHVIKSAKCVTENNF